MGAGATDFLMLWRKLEAGTQLLDALWSSQIFSKGFLDLLELELRISLWSRENQELELSCWKHSGSGGIILESGFLDILELVLRVSLSSR